MNSAELPLVHRCCPIVRAFLQSIGVDAVNPRTIAELLQHFAQEREHLFPRLPRDLSALLQRHHDLFEHEIAAFGELRSWSLFELHSRMEDRAVLELLRAQRSR